MTDKLAYIRNLVSQLDDLEHRQKLLALIKENIEHAEKINLEGKAVINHMAISLNEMEKMFSPEILSHLKLILSQYIDFLIQKNAEFQQKLLSSIEIARFKELDEIATNAKPIIKPFENRSVEEVLEKTNHEGISNSAISPSLREIERKTREQDMRKLIAEEFYRYAKGSYIDPLEVQQQLKMKTGKFIDISEINDLAWVLISQDVLKFYYRIVCQNDHEAFRDYIEPPLPRKILCPICRENVQKVDICYQKILE